MYRPEGGQGNSARRSRCGRGRAVIDLTDWTWPTTESHVDCSGIVSTRPEVAEDGEDVGIADLLMVVDQINIAGRVRLFLVPENQPPVSGDGKAPEPFQVAFEWMQLPARKQAELLQRRRGFEREKKLAQLVSHLGRNPFGVSVFVELP